MGNAVNMVPMDEPVAVETRFKYSIAAGIILGGSPMFLAGAIVSGAIFGDNLAPISDTTIASASTQQFRDGRPADVGGCVKTRFKYSIVAGSIALVLFAILGGIGGTYEGGAIGRFQTSSASLCSSRSS